MGVGRGFRDDVSSVLVYCGSKGLRAFVPPIGNSDESNSGGFARFFFPLVDLHGERKERNMHMKVIRQKDCWYDI